MITAACWKQDIKGCLLWCSLTQLGLEKVGVCDAWGEKLGSGWRPNCMYVFTGIIFGFWMGKGNTKSSQNRYPLKPLFQSKIQADTLKFVITAACDSLQSYQKKSCMCLSHFNYGWELSSQILGDLIASARWWCPTAVLTDGHGQSHWLSSSMSDMTLEKWHVIVLDTMWMEDWPSGKELRLPPPPLGI